MTKIYRLADERDIGKLVFPSNCLLFSDRGKYKPAELLEVFTDCAEEWDYSDGRYHVQNLAIPDEYLEFRCAFVEVTPSDFSIGELVKAIESHGYACFYQNGKQGLVKEKALADFDKQEVIDFLRDKGYVVWNEIATKKERDLSYKEGYEAGKRDAEPKWISVAEKLPPENGDYWCVNIGYKECDHHAPFATKENFYQGRWLTSDTITHWMPLSVPPKEEEKIISAPKYICAACGKSFNQFVSARMHAVAKDEYYCSIICYDKDTDKPKYTCAQCDNEIKEEYCGGISTVTEHLKKDGVYFCDGICRDNYEWVDAEFPMDIGKACRGNRRKDHWQEDHDREWVYNLNFIGFWNWVSEYRFTLVYYDDAIDRHYVDQYKYCQVRRDSVEENK